MSGLYDFNVAYSLRNVPLDALIMAAVMKADSGNLKRLKREFPELVAETQKRWTSPGGKLEGE